MLIAAIYAPYVLSVLTLIIIGFLVAAYVRKDKLMMTLWGVVTAIMVLLLGGSAWLYHQINVGF